MKAALSIARLLCAAAILIIGPVAGISIAIVIFILAGTLVPGEPMYVGSSTPSLLEDLRQAAINVGITSAFAYAHFYLGSRIRSVAAARA